MFDIIGKRYWYFLISLIIILPGMIVMAIWGMPLSIDFKGGTLMQISFPENVQPAPSDIVLLYQEAGINDAQVTTTDNGQFIIKSAFMDEVKRLEIVQMMTDDFGAKPTVIQYDSVGPTIGKEVTSRAGMAIGVAALGVILFITFAFRGIPHAFRYGVCAIIAMAHDVLVVISISAIGGHFFGWQIDSLFLTALLTVIGFSVQDKIVVFDRIRENTNIYRRLPFETLANHSIVQTLQRSINTQLMTSEFMLLAMALFGGVTLREFSLILLIGLLMGTYSSIFIAAPILVIWEKKEWSTWFKRKPKAVTQG
ncbi:MAG: protein translocase subunit SecF [Anaerolineaceae bacterium]